MCIYFTLFEGGIVDSPWYNREILKESESNLLSQGEKTGRKTLFPVTIDAHKCVILVANQRFGDAMFIK